LSHTLRHFPDTTLFRSVRFTSPSWRTPAASPSALPHHFRPNHVRRHRVRTILQTSRPRARMSMSLGGPPTSAPTQCPRQPLLHTDRKSTRLNSSHQII